MSLVALSSLLPALLLTQAVPAPEWRMDSVPLMSIGGPEGSGPTEFTAPYSGIFWGGGLLVVDGGSIQLRHFSLDGKYLGTIARKGKGPGEFTNPAWLQLLRGDSLFVSDILQQRFSIFDERGEHVATTSLVQTDAWDRLVPIGRLDDGTVIAWATRLRSITTPGIHPVPATIYRVKPNGANADSIQTLPFNTVRAAARGKGWEFRVLLGSSQMIPAVSGQTVFLSSPTSYTINRYAPGSGWGVIRRDVPVRLSTAVIGDRMRADAVAQGASERYMATVPVADTLPAIMMIFATRLGNLVVVDGSADSVRKTRGVSIFKPTGEQLSHFIFPTGFVPVAIEDSMIALTERNPEEAPTVAVYRLHPPALPSLSRPGVPPRGAPAGSNQPRQ